MESTNHDKHVPEIELEIEELEAVIAPGRHVNHNETLVLDSEEVTLDVEDLEDIIAPGRRINHNETLVRDIEEITLDVEELEEVIAPIKIQSFVRRTRQIDLR